jgi:hypothetical protein
MWNAWKPQVTSANIRILQDCSVFGQGYEPNFFRTGSRSSDVRTLHTHSYFSTEELMQLPEDGRYSLATGFWQAAGLGSIAPVLLIEPYTALLNQLLNALVNEQQPG